MVAQAPADRVAAKAAHDQAPIRRRRLRIRAKSSFAKSDGVAEACPSPAVSQNVAANESAGCEEPPQLNSEDVSAAGVPTCEVPPSMDGAESPLVDLVSEDEPEPGDPKQVVGLQGLNEVQPKSPAKGVLRRMPVVEILDSPCPAHVKGIVLEDAVQNGSKSLESSKTAPFRDPSRVLMSGGVSETAHECLVHKREGEGEGNKNAEIRSQRIPEGAVVAAESSFEAACPTDAKLRLDDPGIAKLVFHAHTHTHIYTYM